MDIKRKMFRLIVKLPKFYRSQLIRHIFQRIHFVEEDGIYKVIKGKYSWYIPSNDYRQAEWALNFMSTHERYLDSLHTGDIVIEVGATTGEYTIPATKKIGESGQIHAFEADPVVYLCLKKNLELNNIINVKPVNKPVSGKSNKELQLSFRREAMAEASFHRDFLPEKILVKTISLDDYAASIGLENVNVLKVTVNGHEPEVLKGSKNLLKGVRNVIFQSARHQEVISFLKKEGFSVKKEFDIGARSEKAILMEK